ncbi:MAG: hypothetical protein ACRD18_14855 [Terriglobia bacterium]
MRIQINLAHPESRIERSVYVWTPVVILVAAVLLVRLLFSAGHEYVQYRSVHHSALRYQAEVQEMQVKEVRLGSVLRRPETLKLYGQINFLNGLIDQKRVSLSGLTLKVARLLPAQARITGLALVETEKGPVVDISVEGSGHAVAGEFLNNLEGSPDFDGITVTDQSFAQTGPEKGLVTLTCSARYVGKTVPGARAEQAQP